MRNPCAWMAALVLAVVAGAGCSNVPNRAGGASTASGAGVVVAIQRQFSIWVTVRANELDRVQGWSEGAMPSLFVYGRRDLQPVLLPAGTRATVVWIDSGTVIGVQRDVAGGDVAIISPREVTQALLMPPTTDLRGLAAGDRVHVLVEGRS